MSNKIGIDIGYSYTKVYYLDKIVKFPTAVSYASNVGISYGEENVYEFEGSRYYVGKEAADAESFVMTDFKQLNRFAPLIIYHVLNKFEEAKHAKPLEIRTGLALVDWNNKDEFKERLSTFEVNGTRVETNPILMPQGAGSAMDWVYNDNNGKFPDRLTVIDIGYNTINLISFVEGTPQLKDMKGYPGHGVSSILKPFHTYIENTYKMNFSEQETLIIFMKNKFSLNGVLQDDVPEKIAELKSQFIKKLFQSVLVSDKKILSISDKVIIGGGGSYLLETETFPPNVEFSQNPKEYSNVRGFMC